MASPTIHALVVDDEEGIRRLVKLALARHGVECDCASSGTEALALLQSRRYLLAVTDLLMPQGHGHFLCTTLLAREDRPVVVVLTGVAEPRLVDDLKARGVDKIYFKPVNFRVFGDEVYRLVLERLQRQHASRSDPLLAPATAAAAAKDDAGLVQPPSTATSSPSVEALSDRDADQHLVAVIRKARAQSVSLADKLKAPGIDAVPVESTDSLRRLVEARPVSLLIMDNEIGGFFTGLEIIGKLRSASIRVPVLLIDPNERLLLDEPQPPGLVTLVNPAANNDEIAETARRLLSRPPDEQELIPERARALAEHQGDLPLLSHLIIQLLQYLEMPPEDVPLKDLCRDISLDPRASAVLLKAVNASKNGLLREITNIPDAVRVLGVRPTIGRVLNAAMTDGIGSLSIGVPADVQAWHLRRGMLLASTASTFAKELAGGSEETAFLIGILQDLGILCLFRTHPQEYESVLTRWRAVGHLKLGAIEQSEFGCTHAAVSAAMMERWELPRTLIIPVLRHLDSAARATGCGVHFGLHQSIAIAEALVDFTDAPHPNRRHILDSMLTPYGLAKRTACLRSLASATVKAADAFHVAAIPLPGAAELEAMVAAALRADAASLSSETSQAP
jgi:HD-like signal output (HDOD) protein/DNA-binding response OmpR family regulator